MSSPALTDEQWREFSWPEDSPVERGKPYGWRASEDVEMWGNNSRTILYLRDCGTVARVKGAEQARALIAMCAEMLRALGEPAVTWDDVDAIHRIMRAAEDPSGWYGATTDDDRAAGEQAAMDAASRIAALLPPREEPP